MIGKIKKWLKQDIPKSGRVLRVKPWPDPPSTPPLKSKKEESEYNPWWLRKL